VILSRGVVEAVRISRKSLRAEKYLRAGSAYK
jgi:hypothetical protein